MTSGVRDAAGDPVEAGEFGRFKLTPTIAHWRDHDLMAYRKSLLDGEHSARPGRHRVVALSLFTTQSISADLEKIQRQIKRSTPAPVDFMIGNGGSTRAVFATDALTGIQFMRQTGTAPRVHARRSCRRRRSTCSRVRWPVSRSASSARPTTRTRRR